MGKNTFATSNKYTSFTRLWPLCDQNRPACRQPLWCHRCRQVPSARWLQLPPMTPSLPFSPYCPRRLWLRCCPPFHLPPFHRSDQRCHQILGFLKDHNMKTRGDGLTLHTNERYNELWYSPDGATAIRVILLMRCSGRHWQPKQKQTWDAVLRTQMQSFWRTQIPQWGDCQKMRGSSD